MYRKESNSSFGDEYDLSTKCSSSAASEHDIKASLKLNRVKKGDLQPSYAHQLEVPGDRSWYCRMVHCIGTGVGTLGALPLFGFLPSKYRTVDQGQVGLITRYGQFYKTVDPGLTRVNPISEKLYTVEVRVQVVDVPHQTCVTKDKFTIGITSVIYYQVVSPHKARFGINDLHRALQERSKTALRLSVSARFLKDIAERREEMAEDIAEIMNGVAEPWGARVEAFLIKELQ